MNAFHQYFSTVSLKRTQIAIFGHVHPALVVGEHCFLEPSFSGSLRPNFDRIDARAASARTHTEDSEKSVAGGRRARARVLYSGKLSTDGTHARLVCVWLS